MVQFPGNSQESSNDPFNESAFLSKDGVYLVNLEESEELDDKVKFSISVLDAPPALADQISLGTTVSLWTPDPSKPKRLQSLNMNRLMRMAAVLLLYSEEEQAADRTSGSGRSIDFSHAEGTPFIASIEANKNGFMEFKNVWAIGDPDAPAVPKNHPSIQQFNGNLPNRRRYPQANAAPQQQAPVQQQSPQQQPQQAAAATDGPGF